MNTSTLNISTMSTTLLDDTLSQVQQIKKQSETVLHHLTDWTDQAARHLSHSRSRRT